MVKQIRVGLATLPQTSIEAAVLSCELRTLLDFRETMTEGDRLIPREGESYEDA